MSTQPQGHSTHSLTDSILDMRERGANQQTSNRRLFMQFQVFTGCTDSKPLAGALEHGQVEGVLYHDLNDPRGVGILALSEDPAYFATRLRDLLNSGPFAALSHRPDFAMFGRTYASGYEPDLEDYLLRRSRRVVLDPACPWGVWYPLRRSGAFARLSPQEQGAILREHGAIGRAYGDTDLAHDIRLACHGLDAHDNDFVIGLIGRDLHPLSHLVMSMRKTVQTSQYIQSLGPFFVGHVIWQSPAR